MSDNGLRVEDLTFGSRNGFVFVEVPRQQSEELRQPLEALGISSSLHLNPQGGEALVHPRTNLSHARLRDLLLGAGWAKRK